MADGVAVGIRQEHIVALVGDAEIGVQVGRVFPAIHARAVHGQPAAGGQGHGGKLPALELLGLVGQRPAGEIHGAGRGIVDFNVIRAGPGLVHEEGAVVGHDLGDLQRAGLHRYGPGILVPAAVALDAIGRSGGRDVADLPFAGGVPAVHLVSRQGRDLHDVHAVAALVQQRQRLAGGGQAEGGVVAVGLLGLAAVVSVHHRERTGL